MKNRFGQYLTKGGRKIGTNKFTAFSDFCISAWIHYKTHIIALIYAFPDVDPSLTWFNLILQ